MTRPTVEAVPNPPVHEVAPPVIVHMPATFAADGAWLGGLVPVTVAVKTTVLPSVLTPLLEIDEVIA